jgi:pimeloyl-ACP methyl ester carboxylesterase
MTRNDFAYAVRGILYADAGVAELPALITAAAATGDLSEFAQRYWTRAVNLGRSLAHGLHLSVFCAEDIPFATDAEIEAATAGTFMGRYLFDDYRRACALWPRAAIASDFRTPVSARVPVLLISGRFDPVTPPELAERVASSLPLARHIVAPDGAHGVAAGCPRPAVLHLVMRGTLDGMPDVCR